MAGLGRRTHFRKHLTDQVLFELPELDSERDRIAKVVAARGSNQFDLQLANEESAVLAILPTKYRKLVWLKRNDFVIVETVDKEEDDDGKDGIRFMIKHILYKEQIQHLMSKHMWPQDDEKFSNAGQHIVENAVVKDDDGIVYQDSDDEDDLLGANTNRVAALQFADSSDSEQD